MYRTTIAAVLFAFLAAAAHAQTIVAIANDGTTSSIAATWPATSINVEPNPLFVSNHPVKGRVMGLLIWLDSTMKDSFNRTQQVTDVLDAVSEAMRFEARAVGRREPDFVDGMRLKQMEKLRAEFDNAILRFGTVKQATAPAAEIKSVLIENMPPQPSGEAQ